MSRNEERRKASARRRSVTRAHVSIGMDLKEIVLLAVRVDVMIRTLHQQLLLVSGIKGHYVYHRKESEHAYHSLLCIFSLGSLASEETNETIAFHSKQTSSCEECCCAGTRNASRSSCHNRRSRRHPRDDDLAGEIRKKNRLSPLPEGWSHTFPFCWSLSPQG